MKIKSLHLKDFKRFTDLTIQDVPESAKLVVLVGPNGSGKSSLFEAFNVYLARTKNTQSFDRDYHLKFSPDLTDVSQSWASLFQENKISIEFHDHAGLSWQQPQESDKNAFYIRSCYRHEADFSLSSIQKQGNILEDERRPPYLISSDSRVSDNYQRIVAGSLADLYDQRFDNTLVREVRERLIGSIRDSLLRVLPGVELLGPGNPMEDGTFLFKKGQSLDWRYKNLSGGEKAAFDLLLDFVIKTEKFNNTVFCIDEPEVHMHTEVQGPLLQEMLHKLPPDCQLWIATHSIGMMRAAKNLNASNPGTVAFLDFGGHDFDQAVELVPSTTDREFWKKNFNVAIGDLADLVAPRSIFFCEGSRNSTRNNQFDAKCFQTIFAAEFPDVAFVSLGGASEVESNSILVSSVFEQVLAGVQLGKVIDRDARTPTEIAEAQGKGICVLSRRHIEGYLFDDEILEKLCREQGQNQNWPSLQAAKNQALRDSVGRGNPNDDYKSIGSQLHNQVRRLLGLNQSGSRVDAFCTDILAPLVTPETQTYQQLKTDIFGTSSLPST